MPLLVLVELPERKELPEALELCATKVDSDGKSWLEFPNYITRLFYVLVDPLEDHLLQRKLEDWKQHTRYEGSLSPTHPLTKWFRAIVYDLALSNRAKLLAFCTGSSSPPAVGFSRLPGFNGGITEFTLVGIESSEEQLPSASTCFAKLKLPAYKSLDTLKIKLFQAMELSEGFAEAAVAGA